MDMEKYDLGLERGLEKLRNFVIAKKVGTQQYKNMRTVEPKSQLIYNKSLFEIDVRVKSFVEIDVVGHKKLLYVFKHVV